MLGFDGVGIFLAYVLSVLSALLCVIYGVMNWNKPRADETREIDAEITWEKNEDEITKKL